MKTEMMTISEAAKYANVQYKSIWYHIAVSKKLKAKKIYGGGNKSTWFVNRDSIDNLYYKTAPGEKQHVVKPSLVSQYSHIYKSFENKPELLSRAISDEVIEAAVIILKSKGYKVYKPVISHEEI